MAIGDSGIFPKAGATTGYQYTSPLIGARGTSGYSGGASGYSGASKSGYSGVSVSGYSGTGTSGYSGSGTSGYSGKSGYSG